MHGFSNHIFPETISTPPPPNSLLENPSTPHISSLVGYSANGEGRKNGRTLLTEQCTLVVQAFRLERRFAHDVRSLIDAGRQSKAALFEGRRRVWEGGKTTQT